jgi:hypothetical protein
VQESGRVPAQKVSYLLSLPAYCGCKVPNQNQTSYELSHNFVRLLDFRLSNDTPRLTTSAAAVNDLKAMPLAQLESGKSGGMFSRH